MQDDQIKQALAPVSQEKNKQREKTVRERFWPKFRQFAAKIPFAEELVASYFCAIDPQTPSKVQAILLAALVYFIMPIDIIPDFLAFVGLSDDLALMTTVFALVRGHITEAHREQARTVLQEEKQEA